MDHPSRNDKCWCGSGLKYKKCHLNRARLAPATHQEIRRSIRVAFKGNRCLHPEAPSNCSGSLVDSHSIPVACLREIAERGHVMTLEATYDSFLKTDGDISLGSVGIRETSVFPGFCKHHDSATFKPIEDHPYRPCAEHAFLSSYRALCRELFHWRVRARLVYPDLDRGMVPEGQAWVQGTQRELDEQTSRGLESVEHFKRRYDAVLRSADFTVMNFYAIELGVVPDVMVTSLFAPFADFSGRPIRAEASLGFTEEPLVISLFSSASRGWFQIAWLGSSPEGEAFTGSLSQLFDADIPHAIIRLVFTHFDNTYFRPSWWAKLQPRDASYLQRRRRNPANPFEPRTDNYLADDGRRLVRWPVVGRYSSSSLTAAPGRDFPPHLGQET